jgi:glycosyltransferase involved in cell wall biosynthesis
LSRILVVGVGVPSLVRARRHGGPGLRSTHFACAIAAAGHEVLLLAVIDDHETAPAAHEPRDAGPAVEFVRERDLATAAFRSRIARFAPDAVVGATVYASALAARLRLEVPLWADVFGDLMAEAQAKAVRASSDWSLVHFWTLMRTVLERADRFSAVSAAQSHALVGQLGLAGRLSARTSGEELVSVVPCAAQAPAIPADRRAARGALGLGDDDFVLLVSGGVNTWCDVETLAAGLAMAMRSEPRLRLVVTGGAIPGHDETSHAELRARLAELPRERVYDLGWIDSARLADVYAAADLGLHVERSLYERRLGAENRVVEWLAHGLVCVTTAQSESGAELVHEGLSLGCPPGNPAALASVIVSASSAADRALAASLEDARRRGPQWAVRERSFEAAARPLLDWCGQPCFARDRDGARLLQLGLVSQPATSAEMLEAYVAELPMREIVRRGLRWLARRAHGAALGRGLRWPRRTIGSRPE